MIYKKKFTIFIDFISIIIISFILSVYQKFRFFSVSLKGKKFLLMILIEISIN